MKRQRSRKAGDALGLVRAALIGALTFGVPHLAAAGEREEALALCRAAIAKAFEVSADETGAHFVDSATAARFYTMRFQVRAPGAGSVAATCKVRRDPLTVSAITPAGRPNANPQAVADAPVAASEPGAR